MLKLIFIAIMLTLRVVVLPKYVLINILIPLIILLLLLLLYVLPKVSIYIIITKFIYFDYLAIALVILTL